MDINVIKEIWGKEMHTDLVTFDKWIKEILAMLENTKNEPNTYKRGIELQKFNQMLSNNIINALIIAYQNGFTYQDLYCQSFPNPIY